MPFNLTVWPISLWVWGHPIEGSQKTHPPPQKPSNLNVVSVCVGGDCEPRPILYQNADWLDPVKQPQLLYV